MGVLPDLTYSQYNLVYNALSFGIAGMGAACLFVIFQFPNVLKRYRTTLVVNTMVTAIATYHYYRIFNSFDAAYAINVQTVNGTAVYAVTTTGHAFNDAYRYVDWFLTVPLLLIELILVMDLSPSKTSRLSWQLGIASALMVAIGYPGEIADDQKTRWICWFFAMIPFLYVVYNLITGLSKAAGEEAAVESDDEEEEDEEADLVKDPVYSNAKVTRLIAAARYLTAISWLTYPFVYMVKAAGTGEPALAMSLEQVGYSIADLLAKAVFGILIWLIAQTKSDLEEAAGKSQ